MYAQMYPEFLGSEFDLHLVVSVRFGPNGTRGKNNKTPRLNLVKIHLLLHNMTENFIKTQYTCFTTNVNKIDVINTRRRLTRAISVTYSESICCLPFLMYVLVLMYESWRNVLINEGLEDEVFTEVTEVLNNVLHKGLFTCHFDSG